MVPFTIFWGIITIVAATVLWHCIREPREPGMETDPSADETIGRYPAELQFALEAMLYPGRSQATWLTSGLANEDAWVFPVVLDIRPVAVGAHVDVMILDGQTNKDWEEACDKLQHILLVNSVRCYEILLSVVTLELRVLEPLDHSLSPVPVFLPDLEAVPIGVTEYGDLWMIPVMYRNILIAGVPGSGKSGVLWSIVYALSEAIREEFIDLHVIDLKGGIEFDAGAHMFKSFATTIDEAIELLENLDEIMNTRLARMRGNSRKFQPTRVEPLHLLIVDEAASMTAYAADTKQKARINGLMSMLLSKGRAPGISIIVSVQNASKAVLEWRELLQVRIAMRTAERSQLHMILATAQSRDVEPISDKLPGVGYSAVDGSATVQRVRAFEITDELLEGMNTDAET